MKKGKGRVLISLILVAALLLPGQTQIAMAEDEMISEWSWVDESGEIKWNDEEQYYELKMPGNSENNSLMKETLEETLPEEIQAVVSEEKKNIPVKWNLEEMENEISAGEYMLTASLDDSGYVLGSETSKLELMLKVSSQIQVYNSGAEVRAGNGAYPDHIIDTGISPSGTTINLFDYWMYDSDSDRFKADNVQSGAGFNTINQGLKFNYGTEWECNQNIASSSSYVNAGIVKNTLDYLGYPVLNDEYDAGPIVPAEPMFLALPMYAQFDPTYEHAGKKSFTDVKNLLQLDEEGYYYYNSKENFAEFNEATNSFILYDSPGVVSPNYGGQFFPFNTASEVFMQDGVGNLVNNSANIWESIPQQSPIIHHYLGLTMKTAFAQLNGGTNNGKDVIYSFSGDDDVWVFIDGVLVGDVGGMHAPTNLEINFRTGQVHVWGDIWSEREPTNVTTTIKAQFEEAGRYDPSLFNGDTFADGTNHTLSFFYLERGNDASNLSLKYNLVKQPQNIITKTDEEGNALSGIQYELYAADSEYNPTGNAVFTGITDEKGELRIDKDQNEVWTLKELYDQSKYYVLRETTVPEGYRASDIHLKFQGDADNPYWIAENSWETGADMEIRQNLEVDIGELNYKTYISKGYSLAAFIRKKDTNKLVYKDASGNWTEISDTYSSYKEIFEKYPCLLNMNGEGIFEITCAMPPDYYRNPDNYECILKYVKNATYLSVSKLFTTTYTSNLKLVNPKNQFEVEKINSEGNILSGAKFALYDENSVSISGSTITINYNARPYDTGTTDSSGHIIFGAGGTSDSKKPLISGCRYYLKETQAPSLYVVNETVVEVIVDNTGVYANAGEEQDGIKVKTQISGLLPTMKQYAVSNAFDASINDVQAVQQTSDTFGEGWSSGSVWQHYRYGDNGYESTSGTAGFETDTGWSRLEIRQCLECDSDGKEPKQDLGERDLSGSFLKKMTVQVTDEVIPKITVEKKVTGSETDQQFEFTFTVPRATPYQMFPIIQPDGRQTFIKSGEKFFLSDGQQVTIIMLPGLFYVISEKAGADYSTKYYLGDDLIEGSGNFYQGDALQGGESDYILFENSFVQEVDFTFSKVGDGNSPLEGAKFVLYEYTGSGNLDNEQIPVDNNGNIKNDYANAEQWTLHASGKQTSGSEGNVLFTDLKSDRVYRLIEYKAPGDYITPEGQWILKYDSESEEFKVTGSVGNPPAFENITGTVHYRVKNYKLAGLPLTGGRGGMLFIAAGILVMLTGAFWLNRKRKKPVKQ